MSASNELRANEPEDYFCERLDRLEGRERRIQSEHDFARRGPDLVRRHEATDLQAAWRRCCEAIAELNQRATPDFDSLRTWTGRADPGQR